MPTTILCYWMLQEEWSGQGLKRSGSYSWEGEPLKAIKAEHRSASGAESCPAGPLSVLPVRDCAKQGVQQQ